jgi:hypothetical protein
MIMIRKWDRLGIKPVPVPTTNLTWTDLGVNPGLCGEKPTSNCQ